MGKGSGKGRWDFLCLALLTGLTLTFAIILLGIKEGVSFQLLEVSLGAVPSYGVPIPISKRFGDRGGIPLESIGKLEKELQVKVFPYREIIGIVQLPKSQKKILPLWKNPQNEQQDLLYHIRAVSPLDPVWLQGIPKKSSSKYLEQPLEVILDRRLFTQYFQCSSYLEVLQEWFSPETLAGTVPSQFLSQKSEDLPKLLNSDNPLSCFDFAPGQEKIIWLYVESGRREELLPFRFTWMNRISFVDDVAILFPLSTYHLFKVSNAKKYFSLNIHPENEGRQNQSRISELFLPDSLSKELMNSFLSCLGENTEKMGNFLFLKPAQPFRVVQGCAKSFGLRLLKENEDSEEKNRPLVQINGIESSDSIKQDQNFLYIPCRSINKNAVPQKEYKKVSIDQNEWCQFQATSPLFVGPYSRVIIYLPDRKNLSRVVNKLDQEFFISQHYKDALSRIEFIDSILDMATVSLAWFFLVLFLLILIIQVAIVVMHRKHQYGVFLANGISTWEIRGMVLFQVFLCTNFGFLLMPLGVSVLKWSLESQLKKQLHLFQQIIRVKDFDLLSLTYQDYFLVWGFGLGVALGVAITALNQIGIRKKIEPSRVLGD